MIKFVVIILFVAYLLFNIITAKKYDYEKMKSNFIDGQCIVGKILTNVFYAPAWLLKGIKAAVIYTIA